MTHFGAGGNRQLRATASHDRPPFFIVGCGRSGTTLLRVMLNSHQSVAVPLESLFIIDYLLAGEEVPLPILRRLVEDEYELSEWGLEVSPEDLTDCSSVKDLVDRLHYLYMRQHGKQIWGQKTPRFVRYGDLLKATYPGAKFIHLIRDPRAVVSSLIRSNSHRSNAFYGSKRWRRDVQCGLDLTGRFPEDVLGVRYEDLVSCPQEVLRTVCDFIEIQFDPHMLDYHAGRPAEYEYYHSVPKVTDPPDHDRIDAWRDRLSEAQVALIEAICGDIMDVLGYARDNEISRASRLYVWSLRLQRVLGRVQQVVHYIRYRPEYLACVAKRKAILSIRMKSLLIANSV